MEFCMSSVIGRGVCCCSCIYLYLTTLFTCVDCLTFFSIKSELNYIKLFATSA
jgi:hypothetical protein